MNEPKVFLSVRLPFDLADRLARAVSEVDASTIGGCTTSAFVKHALAEQIEKHERDARK
jgi:hypothetical protein